MSASAELLACPPLLFLPLRSTQLQLALPLAISNAVRERGNQLGWLTAAPLATDCS